MPNPNVGQRVAQAWDAYIGGKPEDTIHDEYGQLRRMEKTKKSFTGGGDDILGAIEYKLNSTIAWISDTEVLDTTRVDIFDEYTYVWRQIGETVVMSSFEEAINRGGSKKIDLLEGKLENARMTMRSTINSAIFTAQTGSAIMGLPDLVASSPSSGTVGGINRAVHSFWRNQQTSGAKTSTAFDNLRGSMRTIRTACAKGQGSKEPDYFVGHSTDTNGFESLLIANERIIEANATLRGIDASAYKFGMASVYYDKDATAGTMYALQNDNPKLCVQSGYWFKGYPAVNPANQLLEVFKIESIVQMISGNPRHLGVITGIT